MKSVNVFILSPLLNKLKLFWKSQVFLDVCTHKLNNTIGVLLSCLKNLKRTGIMF